MAAPEGTHVKVGFVHSQGGCGTIQAPAWSGLFSLDFQQAFTGLFYPAA